MSPRTKSKHLDKYIHFLDYDDPKDIPFDKLSKQLDVHPNLLRGMIRSARSNGTIYTALRQMDIGDRQIPRWFARPDKQSVSLRVAPAGQVVTAEERSDAEVLRESAVRMHSQDNTYIVQEGSAERFSMLSVSSAPPVYTYQLEQPVYQPPMSPMVEEAFQLLHDTIEEDMREKLNRMRRRRAPPKPPTLEQLKAMAGAFRIRQQIEANNTAQMLFLMNMLQAPRTSKRLHLKEPNTTLIRSFEGKKSEGASRGTDTALKEMFEAIGSLFNDYIPRTGMYNDYLQMYKDVIREKRKGDKEARIEFAKFVVENRKRKNERRRFMERQNRKIVERFLKEMNEL